LWYSASAWPTERCVQQSVGSGHEARWDRARVTYRDKVKERCAHGFLCSHLPMRCPRRRRLAGVALDCRPSVGPALTTTRHCSSRKALQARQMDCCVARHLRAIFCRWRASNLCCSLPAVRWLCDPCCVRAGVWIAGGVSWIVRSGHEGFFSPKTFV
jgi:hypothetical protein